MFTKDELNRLNEARQSLEQALGFEIKLVIKQSSDDYLEASFRGGLLLSVLGMIQVLLVQFFCLAWLSFPLLMQFALGVILFCLGYVIVSKSVGLKRYLSSDFHSLRLNQEAARQYLSLQSEGRPLNMLYVSYLEADFRLLGPDSFSGAFSGVDQKSIRTLVKRHSLAESVILLLRLLTPEGRS